MKNKRILIIMILTFFIASLLNITPTYAKNEKEEKPSIYSEAAILVDSRTGKVLYNKNSKEKKYPASTTKILTAIVTIENCNLDDVVTVDYDSIAIVPPDYTVATLQVGEELTVKQLLQVMLIHSANDAANVLAKHVAGSIDSFASMMNSKAHDIGCQNSHFLNPSGKHEENHYSTAYDLALIMNYCMKNETFRDLEKSRSCIIPATNKYPERMYTNSNDLLVIDTREVPTNYYYEYAIAGKTGYTSEAKNCLVSVANKDDLELICVVLGGLRTDDGRSARFVDTKNIFEYGYNTYANRKLKEAGSIAKHIEINNATDETKDLDLLISDEIIALIKQKDFDKEIEPEITLNDNLSAPIAQGDVLGKITYKIEDIEYTSDLKASHMVEKKDYFVLIIQIILIIMILYILFRLINDFKSPTKGTRLRKKRKALGNGQNFNFKNLQ